MESSRVTGIALRELAERCGVELAGDGELMIYRVATLEDADANAISFLSNARYRGRLASTRAGAVIVAPRDVQATILPKLVTSNPYAVFARIATMFHPRDVATAGIDPTAIIAATAKVAASAMVGPHVVIGHRAAIGERAQIHAGCVVGDGCTVGEDVTLYPRVVLYADCVLGARTIVHSGAVIGADGFGMAEQDGRWIKVPQVGSVDGTTISAMTGVSDSITTPGVYTAAFPTLPHREWQHVASVLRRLRSFAKRVRALEQEAGRKGE